MPAARVYRGRVGSSGPDQQVLIESARAAHREHRYDAAYDGLRAAQDLGGLVPEDLHRLADAAWWLGLVPECLRITESAHREFLSSGNLDRAATQALDIGGMLAMRGEPALAAGWLSRARRLLEGIPVGPAHGTLWYIDLSFALGEGHLDLAAQLAADLCRLGRESGPDDSVALGQLGEGLVLLRRGQVAEAFARFDEAMLLAVGGLVDPEWAGHICCMIVSACLDVADLDKARLWSRAAYRWLEDFEHAVMFTGVCRAHTVALLVSEGEWLAAEREAALVVRDLAELNVAAVAEVEYQRGDCHRLRGELVEAEAAYARGHALGRDPQPGLALLQLARGDEETAWGSVSDAMARSSADPFRSARLLRATVTIGLATDHVRAAGAAAGSLRELAETYRTPGYLAWAAHCDGAVALARGQTAAALERLTWAAMASRRMRAWCDAAATDLLLAEVHLGLGDEAKSTSYRDSASAVLRRLGIAAPEQRARRVRSTPLTARESEVLAQVATGAANRVVAEAMSISEATVRRHLANIFRKLDVRSRTEAAAWAHRHGLVPETQA